MADTVVYTGDGSPESVALKLLEQIRQAEGRVAISNPIKPGHTTADRKWLLDTYAECLLTVKNPGRRFPKEP